VRTVGRRVADPLGLLRVLSAERRQVLRAQVRARVQARRVRLGRRYGP